MIKEMIIHLGNAKVSPTQIQRFLLEKGEDLATIQIQTILKHKEVQKFASQTEELIQFMNRENNAITKCFEQEINGILQRYAVLTITENELKNLHEFGDVIFIDGTYANLKMRWEVIPITAINKHLQLTCCGIMYASVTNEMILHWLLKEIWCIVSPVRVLKTIVTDDDAAFGLAFQNFVSDINQNEHHVIHHVLCALHKQRNFEKKLTSCGLSKSQREIALELFRKVCYHTNLEYVEECIARLKVFSKKLTKYIEKHVIPDLPHFSKAYLIGVQTNGYNTRSPGESMNNLLKNRLNGELTLKQSRAEFIRALENHERNNSIKQHRALVPSGFIKDSLDGYVSCRICEKIQNQIKLMSTVKIEILEQEDFGGSNAVSYHINHPEIKYKVSETYCTCNTITFVGIPCCHILKFYDEKGLSFPFNLINERWRLNSEPVSDIGFDEVGENVNDLSEEEDQFDMESNDPDEFDARIYYLRLFHAGKTLSSLASRNKQTALQVLKLFNDTTNELLNVNLLAQEPESSETNLKQRDVMDAIARAKGRPKKRLKYNLDRRGVHKCRICDRAHETCQCKYYDQLLSIMNKHEDYDGDQRRCGLCTEPGHNNRTCPLRLRAIEFD